MANASKARKELFYILTTLSICFSLVYSVLNVEELNSVQYGFEILNEPVLVKEVSDVGSTLVLSSKHGQQYQCTLPEFVNSENLAEQTQSISNDEIAQLFEPMKRKCLYNNKGWWTYEVCLGKGIYQYHEEGHQIIGEKISLGVFSTETDWTQKKIDSKVNKKPGKSTKVKQFHSQFYINGSKCDLTGKPRETQIKFFCEEGSADVVTRVDEPSSCSYIITVNTKRLCHYSLFKSTPTHTAKSITCSPALSEERYKIYIDGIESKRKAKEESVAKAARHKIKSHSKESEMEESANEQEKEKKKKRTSRRSQVWPWEEPGVESDDEVWIDGNIGHDQIGVHRLDITKGRRRPGGMDDGDLITVMSQKLTRDRIPSSQNEREDSYKGGTAKDKGKKVEDDEKKEVQFEKLDQADKPAVVKEEGRQHERNKQNTDEYFDHKNEEENKGTKLSEGSASSTETKQNDKDAAFREQELEEKWQTNMQKTVLKMRAALKDKLVKLGIKPEVLDKTFKEKLEHVVDGESSSNDALDLDSENLADSVTKDEKADELVDKDAADMSAIQDTLLEDLKLLSNVLTKDLMVSIVKAAKVGQDALDEQLAKERAQLLKEVELARTAIKEIQETEEMTGVKDEKRGKTVVKIKEAIEQFETKSTQLDSDMVAFKELNKEIFNMVQDEANSEKSDFKKNLVELSLKANKLVRRIILASFQVEQDVLSIKKMRFEITTRSSQDGKSEKGAKLSQIDDLSGGMDLVISKLSAMIQNVDSEESSSKEDSRAADDTGHEPVDQRNAGVETPESPDETGVTDDEVDSESRVKVRVSRVRKIATDEESGLNEESEFDEEEMAELGINEKLKQATKKMEELVKQQLKDSGVAPAGKIRVKIVTSKEAFKNLDGKNEMKLLSEREENQFTEMIMNLLGGNLEAGKERRRQESLENNYNLVWNEDKLQSVAQEKEDSDSEVEVGTL